MGGNEAKPLALFGGRPSVSVPGREEKGHTGSEIMGPRGNNVLSE